MRHDFGDHQGAPEKEDGSSNETVGQWQYHQYISHNNTNIKRNITCCKFVVKKTRGPIYKKSYDKLRKVL